MINALTIDLEFWWCNEFLKDYVAIPEEDVLLDSMYVLLDRLQENNARATFFVLGSLAEEYPEVIDCIYEQGHEIACHGYSHTMLEQLGVKKFEEEIKRSKSLLNKYKPIGFRAPCFSINNNTKWAFKILEKYHFKYDSSIFPVKTNLYGVPNAPVCSYKPSEDDVALHDPEGKIDEFPLSVINIVRNIPIAGGFYLRALPFWFSKWGIDWINKTRPANIYIHPWEFGIGSLDLDVPLTAKFTAVFRSNTLSKKFSNLLKRYQFAPMKEVLYDI